MHYGRRGSASGDAYPVMQIPNFNQLKLISLLAAVRLPAY
jgi:hypothetical protein